MVIFHGELLINQMVAMFGRISIVFFFGGSIVIPSLVGTVYNILTIPGYVSVAIVSISGVVVR